MKFFALTTLAASLLLGAAAAQAAPTELVIATVNNRQMIEMQGQIESKAIGWVFRR